MEREVSDKIVARQGRRRVVREGYLRCHGKLAVVVLPFMIRRGRRRAANSQDGGGARCITVRTVACGGAAKRPPCAPWPGALAAAVVWPPARNSRIGVRPRACRGGSNLDQARQRWRGRGARGRCGRGPGARPRRSPGTSSRHCYGGTMSATRSSRRPRRRWSGSQGGCPGVTRAGLEPLALRALAGGAWRPDSRCGCAMRQG